MQEGESPSEPGQVIKPGDKSTAPDSQHYTTQAPPTPEVVAAEPVQEGAPLPSPDPGVQAGTTHIEWTASEYIANPKTPGWYGMLAAGSGGLAILAFIVTRDPTSAIVIAVLGVIMGTFAARQPRTLSYSINNQGLRIGEKLYPYESFKSFSIASEHAIGFISLLPLRRFMPPLIVHYAPEDEDRIAGTLAEYLPFEEHKPDLVDSITRRIRF